MSTKKNRQPKDAADLPCICALIRKAARVVTQRYDGFLKESGLRITQYSMLMNIRRHPHITVSNLSRLLRMEQTTVTRNLKVLERLRYITLMVDMNDQRVKNITITRHGKTMLQRTRSSWNAAQHDLTKALGAQKTTVLVESLSRLTEL